MLETPVELIEGVSLAIAAAVAAGMIFFLLRSRRNYLALPELAAEDFAIPDVDLIVVVPARNEEKNIARVVSSFPRGWVLVVDDESTDRTAEIARQNTAEVIPAPRLQKGLMGKPNACAAGAAATKSEWILFVDADTWYAPEFLCSLMKAAIDEQLDMATVFPRQVTKSFWEKVILPYAFAMVFCGINGRSVNDPSSYDSAANGQCILFRRSFYDFIGGHAAVIKSVIEDAAIAERAKRHRGRIRVFRAEKLAFVRMYAGLGEIWRGFSKNSFRFLAADPKMGAWVLTASLFVLSWLPALGVLLYDGQRVAAFAFAFLPVFLYAPWYGGVLEAMLAPLAIYAFQAIALNGMLVSIFGRKAFWKGRAI